MAPQFFVEQVGNAQNFSLSSFLGIPFLVEQLMHMQETIKVTGFTQNEQVSLNCLCCKTFSILFLLIS